MVLTCCPTATLLFSMTKRTSPDLDRWDDGQIVVQSLETGVRKTIIEGGNDARYVPTGHIVYASGGTCSRCRSTYPSSR